MVTYYQRNIHGHTKSLAWQSTSNWTQSIKQIINLACFGSPPNEILNSTEQCFEARLARQIIAWSHPPCQAEAIPPLEPQLALGALSPHAHYAPFPTWRKIPSSQTCKLEQICILMELRHAWVWGKYEAHGRGYSELSWFKPTGDELIKYPRYL